MVEIQSKEVIDKISEELKVQPSLMIPRELGKDIQLVYNVNDEHNANIVRNVEATSSGSTVVFTTPTDRDFFLTSLFLGYTKDVISDNVVVVMQGTEFGGTVRKFLNLDSQTLTVTNDNITITYKNPIKMKRGTGIAILGVFTVGTLRKSGSLTGYTTDPL